MTISKRILRHRLIVEVPFFDVDSMDIVWHGHYVKYLEMARCAFLKALDYDYAVMKKQGYGWPVVQLQLKYVRPAQFGQKIQIEVILKEYESCLKFDYVIIDCDSGQKLTKASTMQMAVALDSKQTQFQTPPCWIAVVEKALREGINEGAQPC